MRDDFLTSDWARHHGDTTDAIRDLLANIGHGLTRLSARQFDAPWRNDVGRNGGQRART